MDPVTQLHSAKLMGRCGECGKVNHFAVVCRSKTNRAVHGIDNKHKIEHNTEEDVQIDIVNIKFLNHDHKFQT